ncbi:hypothetical protein ACTFIR_003845 [Dictyostelium discoideum]
MPIIPDRIEYVFDTSRSTNLAIGDVRVYAVEHVFAALKASGDIQIVAHRHQYFWELKDVKIKKLLTPLFLGEYIPIPSLSKYGVHRSFYPNKTESIFKDQDVEPTKKQIYYSTDDITRHVEEIVLRFIFILSYRHNAEYILSGNNFKISRHIGSQYFHFIQRLSQCLHGFGIKDFKTNRRKVFRLNRCYCTNDESVEVDQVCVIVCRLSKMVHIVPYHKIIDSQNTAQLLLNHVYRLHGFPRTIISEIQDSFQIYGGYGQRLLILNLR